MKKVEVFINRVHKGSPYNVSHVIPELEVDDLDKVIFMKDVLTPIAETYGKKLIVQICPFGESFLYEYEIEKTKAKYNTQELLNSTIQLVENH